MTEDELKAIEARANTPPFTADNDVANSDVLALVAEVRRLRALLAETVPQMDWLTSERDTYDLEENGIPALMEKLRMMK